MYFQVRKYTCCGVKKFTPDGQTPYQIAAQYGRTEISAFQRIDMGSRYARLRRDKHQKLKIGAGDTWMNICEIFTSPIKLIYTSFTPLRFIWNTSKNSGIFFFCNLKTLHAAAAIVRSLTMTQNIGRRSSWRSWKLGEKDVLGLSIFYAIDFWALLSHNQGQSLT